MPGPTPPTLWALVIHHANNAGPKATHLIGAGHAACPPKHGQESVGGHGEDGEVGEGYEKVHGVVREGVGRHAQQRDGRQDAGQHRQGHGQDGHLPAPEQHVRGAGTPYSVADGVVYTDGARQYQRQYEDQVVRPVELGYVGVCHGAVLITCTHAAVLVSRVVRTEGVLLFFDSSTDGVVLVVL